jgi:hypothetical protein
MLRLLPVGRRVAGTPSGPVAMLSRCRFARAHGRLRRGDPWIPRVARRVATRPLFRVCRGRRGPATPRRGRRLTTASRRGCWSSRDHSHAWSIAASAAPRRPSSIAASARAAATGASHWSSPRGRAVSHTSSRGTQTPASPRRARTSPSVTRACARARAHGLVRQISAVRSARAHWPRASSSWERQLIR